MPKNGWAAALAILAISLPLLLIIPACAQKPLSLEERARALDKRIMCPVCPGETIDQTQAEIGKQLRALVREKLVEGWSEEEILQYLAAPERYGPSILAAPPMGGFSVLAWIGPPVGIALALGVLVLVLRAMRRSAAAQPQAASRREDLAPYLTVVDQELQTGPTPSAGESPRPARSKQGRQR